MKEIPELSMDQDPLEGELERAYLRKSFGRKFVANNLQGEDRKSACLVLSVDILSEKIVYIFPYW